MTSQQLIEQALKDNEDCRNSDRMLIIRVWELQMGQPMHPKLKAFILDKAIMPETMTRHRRKLQEQGKYKANDKVQAERQHQEQAYRAEYGIPKKVFNVVNPLTGESRSIEQYTNG